MHKSKDGKVIASLTEVKNKTGDIFALVDEFGEVTLTSYNKPRYRILKIGVSEMLEEEGVKTAPQKVKTIKKTFSKKIIEKKEVKRSEPKVIKKEEKSTSLIKAEVVEALSKLKVWDRNSRKERSYVNQIKQPLQ